MPAGADGSKINRSWVRVKMGKNRLSESCEIQHFAQYQAPLVAELPHIIPSTARMMKKMGSLAVEFDEFP